MKTKLINFLLNLLVQIRLFGVVQYFFSTTLTVLNYHRIDDPFQAGFDTLKINVSATSNQFALQMDYVKAHYNVISCQHLDLWLRGESKLPPHAAIITFDDGYCDNFSNAYPILKERNLPAIIFLATDFIGGSKPFYWDYISYCFYHTKKKQAHLPLTGDCSWIDENSRDLIMYRWIESLKKIPDVQKIEYMSQIGKTLDVVVPEEAFDKLYLNWDQVRAMSESGLIEFGAHTVTHPILTRIPIEQAAYEIRESKKKIEEETGKTVFALAYPNGGDADFSPVVIQAAKETGIVIAFSLLAGPTRYTTVKKDPFAIRRIFLAYYDSFPRFVAMISGLERF